MSNDGWGKGWPVDISKPWPEAWIDPINKAFNEAWGVDISTKPDITVIVGKMKDGQLIADYFTGEAAQSKIKEYENAVPTHDPYTNPDMHIYHECGCGAILDPNTKSFAELNTAASQVGWKIRWGVHTYRAYCRKCGEGVE